VTTDGLSPDDQRALFEEYHRTRDLMARDRLATSNLRLALHLARRFEHRGIPLDDLVQVASFGLLRAIDRFDPARGIEFSTFATPTILGELKRHFRDKGWAVRVPRRVQELNLRLNACVTELTHQLGRSPTIGELAQATRATEEEVLEAIEASQAYRSESIDSTAADDPAAQLGADDLRLFAAEDRIWVEDLIKRLSPRDQLLVRLRFFDEMTQHQIAARLGISQMHVSRLLARSIEELRRHARSATR
jgi:RNA polymerase sigma-B factor